MTVDGDVLGARELGGPDWPLDTEHDDPEMHFMVLVIEDD